MGKFSLFLWGRCAYFDHPKYTISYFIKRIDIDWSLSDGFSEGIEDPRRWRCPSYSETHRTRSPEISPRWRYLHESRASPSDPKRSCLLPRVDGRDSMKWRSRCTTDHRREEMRALLHGWSLCELCACEVAWLMEFLYILIGIWSLCFSLSLPGTSSVSVCSSSYLIRGISHFIFWVGSRSHFCQYFSLFVGISRRRQRHLYSLLCVSHSSVYLCCLYRIFSRSISSPFSWSSQQSSHMRRLGGWDISNNIIF